MQHAVMTPGMRYAGISTKRKGKLSNVESSFKPIPINSNTRRTIMSEAAAYETPK